MQKFLSHQKLIYNPELRFRKEEHRCIAYTIDDFFYSPDKVSVLLPQEVITLLLFDGEHTFLEVAKNVSYVFGLSREEVESLPLDKLEKINALNNRWGYPIATVNDDDSVELI